MSEHSTIEWTDSTWNPTRGCSRVSPGCQHCYAERVAGRFSGPGLAYEGFATTKGWTRKVALVEDKLEEPLGWMKPRRIFVDSMSDLFHEELRTHDIDRVFGVMALASWHTMQVLTKRPERMREYLNDPETPRRVAALVPSRRLTASAGGRGLFVASAAGVAEGLRGGWRWPLANVWVGTSVENQPAADERVHHLLQAKAAVRFISAEPLLGPLNLRRIPRWNAVHGDKADALAGGSWSVVHGYVNHSNSPRIDWVIVGGESGPGARPMREQWAREVRDDCVNTGVPFFFKQWGEHNSLGERVGKKAAGRTLDGKVWDEAPRRGSAEC